MQHVHVGLCDCLCPHRVIVPRATRCARMVTDRKKAETAHTPMCHVTPCHRATCHLPRALARTHPCPA